jgi:hypothetical protein
MVAASFAIRSGDGVQINAPSCQYACNQTLAEGMDCVSKMMGRA